MRALFVGVVMATFTVAFVGCSKKIDWDSQNAVRYDKARDGDPKPMGGPGKGKKGAGGVAAP